MEAEALNLCFLQSISKSPPQVGVGDTSLLIFILRREKQIVIQTFHLHLGLQNFKESFGKRNCFELVRLTLVDNDDLPREVNTLSGQPLSGFILISLTFAGMKWLIVLIYGMHLP